ncbi:glutamyl-tRNA(Gln) amidotransferase subunit B, mitochondrial [Agrilus planipennis]|uniref:Glutamyl-tRNA(Gln) amidotransferase subunit B, mitochondrial n=1 Tax=Agrilus planipennis TaxID=224129 RepID=A0A1W4WXK0_AGRPL|nr:glutamyl-tRNA(Gln) amidotransferase subunit B, mitochondrial [Agrilus planipennis]
MNITSPSVFKMLIKRKLFKKWQLLRCIKYCFVHTNKTKWQSVVGLEIHAQINSKSKLFSDASTDFAGYVNSNTSLFDAAIPGTLPVLNKQCVKAGVLTALALNCQINSISMFDRKHYFYSDLPAGYQITQQHLPLASSGHLEFQVFNPSIHKIPYSTKVRLKQLQLEQDSGRSLHAEDVSLVNLNRAGIPLMELVFEPDLKDGEEAAALVKELLIILKRLNTCSCKMEEGSLRVDANVSVNRVGEPIGTRTEIKNIGSIRGVASAVTYEIQRQIDTINAGGSVTNETRAWNAVHKTTVGMRDKEEKQDYRYMPEPNLPPLYVALNSLQRGCVNVEELKVTLPELPHQTRKHLMDKYGLTPVQAIILVNENDLLELFTSVKSKDTETDYCLVANIIINDFLSLVHKYEMELENVPFRGEHLGEIVELLQGRIINKNTAKLVIQEILNGSKEMPKSIIKEKNWTLMTNKELETLCNEVIEENSKIVKQYKAGKTKVFAALLGKIANKSNQRADMKKADSILKQLLKK